MAPTQLKTKKAAENPKAAAFARVRETTPTPLPSSSNAAAATAGTPMMPFSTKAMAKPTGKPMQSSDFNINPADMFKQLMTETLSMLTKLHKKARKNLSKQVMIEQNTILPIRCNVQNALDPIKQYFRTKLPKAALLQPKPAATEHVNIKEIQQNIQVIKVTLKSLVDNMTAKLKLKPWMNIGNSTGNIDFEAEKAKRERLNQCKVLASR